MKFHGQLFDHPIETHVEVLQRPGHFHRPAFVAEIAFDLAHDGGRRVGRQLDATIEIKPVYRLDETDRAYLDEILDGLPAGGEAPGQALHQWKIASDQLFTRGGLAVLRPNGHLIVSLNHLASTHGNQIYTVWLTGSNGAQVKVGSFYVDGDGTGFLEVDNMPTSASLWISVNREPGPAVTKPTGPTILSGTISL